MDPECINLAKRLKCATCERTRCFNDKVCMDFVFLHDIKHTYLHILDPAGGYNLFAWSPSRSPDDVLKIFHSSWAQWAGYPRRILLDQDGGFEGTFAEMIGRVSELDYSAAEAHWQNGEVESFNKAFRFAAERVIDERQLAGQDEMQTLGIIVSAAMTDKVRTERVRRCLSTCWTARGKSKLYKDKNQMKNFGYRQNIRAQADMLISQYKIDHALCTAVNRKGRPSRLT